MEYKQQAAPKGRRGKNHSLRGTYNKQGRKNPTSTTGGVAFTGGAGSVSNNTGMVLRYLPLYPFRTRRNLIYAPSGLTTITGTATANAYVFSVNGLYDPDITGTGGQPLGFDQLMNAYNHYTVLSARIRCNITNTSTVLPLSVGVMVSGTTTITTSIEQLLENGYLTYSQLGFYGSQGSVNQACISCDCAEFQGIDSIMSDPNMRGDAVSNPGEQMYFHVCTWNPASVVQITSLLQPIIEYDVVFSEPRKMALS